jgi:hypothetical protein
LLTGDALAAVIVSFLAGVTTRALVWRRRFDAARFGAAVAVASIIAGWALARWPTILPGLTIDNGASGHDTLVWIVVSVLVGGAITFASLGLLFGLTLTGRFQAEERSASGGIARRATFGPRWATRAAVSSFIAGIGLLTFAEAAWAHGIGVVCLFGFIIAAFLAIVPQPLRTTRRTFLPARVAASSRTDFGHPATGAPAARGKAGRRCGPPGGGHELAAGAADQPALVDRALSSEIVRCARRRVDRLRRGGVCGWGGWPPARARVVSVRRLATRGDWCPQVWQTRSPSSW